MHGLQHGVLSFFIACGISVEHARASQRGAPLQEFYVVAEGKVDARTYNGYRRYHASCNHCHGPDGIGSTFGPPLTERLPDLDSFRRIVRDGQSVGTSVMKGFSNDPNIAPYIDDLYAYLRARADGALGRGRPVEREQ
jgi:mono/diheme cytochrome c family protein